MLNDNDKKFDLDHDGKLNTWEQQNKLNVEYDMPEKKKNKEIPTDVPDEVYEHVGGWMIAVIGVVIAAVVIGLVFR